MLSTELEYLCTGSKCFLQCWNAFVRVGILLYRGEIHSRGVECFLEGRNAFDRVGIHLYRVVKLSTELAYLGTELECFLQGWNAFCRDGMLSAGLECFLQGWNAFYRVGIPLYRV
jgi:hypothetical protein